MSILFFCRPYYGNVGGSVNHRKKKSGLREPLFLASKKKIFIVLTCHVLLLIVKGVNENGHPCFTLKLQTS